MTCLGLSVWGTIQQTTVRTCPLIWALEIVCMWLRKEDLGVDFL